MQGVGGTGADTLITTGSQEITLPSDFPTGVGNNSSSLQEKGKDSETPLISNNGGKK